jgi:hypothetical protein
VKLGKVLALVAGVSLSVGNASAAEPASSGLYEVTTDTGMPHLEENLRYARKTEKRCLDLRDLSGEFWMLRDVSLQDCRLVKTAETPGAAAYLLSCEGGHGTSGQAVWQLDQERVAGTLDVRLGGKNMTFYQRITARPLGACG